MTYLQSFNQSTRRPVALALTVTVGALGGLLAGQARAADVPQTYTPAPAPYVEERVQTSFSRFGPYVGVRGGAAWVDDTDFAITGATVTNTYEDWNLTGSAFAGYEMEFFPGFGGRIEAELGYSSFNIEDHLVGGAVQAGSDGDTTAFTGMVNAYVDANLGAFRPFAGVGLGMAQVNFNDHGTTAGVLMDDDDTKFAWQVAGGVGYDLTSNITLEGMVRYQSIMDVGLTSTAAGGSVSSSTDLNSTQGLLGLRYRF
ncbi:MAG: outer membrane beta-barrel protein [Pseudomonadota bacterium]